jgi:hypothetical protein
MPAPKKRRYTKRTPHITYSITLPNGEVIDIMESANAWWMDRGKVERLIAAYGIDCSVQEACAYAGVTARQYKYFNEIHPEFKEVRETMKSLSTIKARKAIMRGIEEGGFWEAMKFLEKALPEEFGPPSRRKKNLVPVQTTPILVTLDEYNRIVGVDQKTRKPLKKATNIQEAIPKKESPEEQRYTTVFKGLR